MKLLSRNTGVDPKTPKSPTNTAAHFKAVGIYDQQEWRDFAIRATDIYHGSCFHYSEFTPVSEIVMTVDYW